MRHGRTEWNRLGLLQGTVDVPLDAVGRRQADRLGRAMANRPLARVYSSPLLRARETAERILAARRSTIKLVLLDDLRELSYGLWQGKTPRQRTLADPRLERCWRTKPWRARFPGGETLTQLMRRADHAIHRIHEESEDDADAPSLVVAHGHILRAMLLRLHERPVEDFWRIDIPNASLLTYPA